MTDRYFVEAPISADRVVLDGPEAHHLTHVMRVRPGARVVLFDGSGAEFAAQVERAGRAEVELAVLARREVDRELPLDLSLGVALMWTGPIRSLPNWTMLPWLTRKKTLAPSTGIP